MIRTYVVLEFYDENGRKKVGFEKIFCHQNFKKKAT